MSGIAFENVGNLHPLKTKFEHNHEKKFDCELGQLIPILSKLCLPGDYWEINLETLVRCLPLITPAMHDVTIDTHYFFVPLRLLDDTNANPGCGNPRGDPELLDGEDPGIKPDDPIQTPMFYWQPFITGGFKGTDDQAQPEWDPINASKYSLWDYLGYRPFNTGR